MSDKYKFQLIRNYLKFHVKDGRELKDLLDYLDQLQQKENIIKEVREYVNKYINRDFFDLEHSGEVTIKLEIKGLLEILDEEKE